VPPDAALPGPHPQPPPDLVDRSLPIKVAPAGTLVFRLHRLEHEPLYFGRLRTGRFDAPNGEFGVLYLGASDRAAFIETFGRTLGVRVVAMSDLAARALAMVRLARALQLVDLTGPGLAKLGADARLCSGDYTIAQQWALAIWQHPQQPDGLLWPSRFDPGVASIAVFDRSRDALEAKSLGSLAETANRERLRDMLDTYSFGLV
jgi:hypothetical protein